ncbi:Aspartate 1-decarboxylase precursor [Poriferisphaera corsica]|uniref:Aspartate 1-decarboxylase n=1 Tax=Poriferisphaera corsica TaxID=2528020 RepID=A0A517YVZ5_9BACT|nr:aspartate 1-decarboxylase [Poriferisphaera corsica]QDU34386.1 Aspartate 1-decarboxylase precursor [Poriferisphaera corsica]
MLRKVLRSKIHRATITQCDLHYVGSITIDADLLHEVDIRPNETVWIYDIDNGARLETYVIRGKAGSGIIGINGAAARLVEKGHQVIIASYGLINDVAADLDNHVAKVVICDAENKVEQRLTYDSLIDVAEDAAV